MTPPPQGRSYGAERLEPRALINAVHRNLRLSSFIADRRELGLDDFVARHSCPVLLGRPGETAADADETATNSVVSALTHSDQPRDLRLAPGMIVHEIVKRPGGLFPDIIAVGRARNSDLCISSDRISKFHAYFTVSEDRRIIRVADAGSKNGTFLDGEPLTPKVPVTIEDGALLAFATHTFRYHTPARLFELLTPFA